LSADLAAFIRGLPKAELHLHIEGTLEPEMMFSLAEKHGVKLKHGSVDALRRAYDFADLQSFLDLYEGAPADERDFRLTRVPRAARASWRRHAEIFDPRHRARRPVRRDRRHLAALGMTRARRPYRLIVLCATSRRRRRPRSRPRCRTGTRSSPSGSTPGKPATRPRSSAPSSTAPGPRASSPSRTPGGPLIGQALDLLG
jgi:hypothetical protein